MMGQEGEGAGQVLVGGVGKVQAAFQMRGFIGIAGQAAAVEIGRQGGEAGRREAIGDAANLRVQAPPFLNQDQAWAFEPLAAVGLGQVGGTVGAVRAREVDGLSHVAS